MRPLQRQGGLSLILAIFVLVVLAILGASMTRLLGAGSESTAREVIAVRALMAAESGAQRKLNEIFSEPTAALRPAICTTASALWSHSIDGLNGCEVDVDCDVVTVSGANYYTINSTGECGPSAAPSVRIVEIQAQD